MPSLHYASDVCVPISFSASRLEPHWNFEYFYLLFYFLSNDFAYFFVNHAALNNAVTINTTIPIITNAWLILFLISKNKHALLIIITGTMNRIITSAP
ncbi:MAG: hypothetical protein SFU91_13530 [Chloroherpetonaceae bacterium]|nr:hypothetical protein [Chloroherpetonaceae bacterium]